MTAAALLNTTMIYAQIYLPDEPHVNNTVHFNQKDLPSSMQPLKYKSEVYDNAISLYDELRFIL